MLGANSRHGQSDSLLEGASQLRSIQAALRLLLGPVELLHLSECIFGGFDTIVQEH